MLAIVHAAYAEHASLDDPPSSGLAETLASIERAMTTARVAIAELSATPVGVVFFEAYVDFMTLFRLGVIPDARRRGVGSSLVAFVEERAREDGAGKVRLIARLALPRSIAFYEARGYRAIDRTSAHLVLEKRSM